MDSALWVLAALALVAIAGAVLFVRPDMDWDWLRQRYKLPESQFLNIGDNIVVHVRDTGPRDGPVLVLLHGFGASVHTWMGWTQVLDAKRRVISLDLKGFGLTSAPHGSGMTESDHIDLVAKTLDQLGVDRFALLGHSMGGGFAWRFALAFPDRVSALILSGAMGKPPAAYQANLDRYRSLAYNPLIRALVPWVMSRFFIARGMVNGFADKSLATPARVARAEHLARGPNQRLHIFSMIATMKRDDAAMRLNSLTMPTLIMHGTADLLVPVSAGQELAATISGARILLYDQIGHVLQEEVVEKGAKDLEAFLDQAGA